MSVQLGNGIITFADGTTLNSANIPYANFTSAPTQLSQFTNDLGNYGSFLSIANVSYGVTYGGGFSGSSGARWYWGLGWNGSKITLVNSNCNCNCNC